MLVFLISIFGFIGITNVSAQVAAAKEFKADCIAEIENSNFNPHVIDSCQTQTQAAAGGYGLSVTNMTYDADGNVNTAEVIVTYSYTIPLFGISQTQETRGIAR